MDEAAVMLDADKRGFRRAYYQYILPVMYTKGVGQDARVCESFAHLAGPGAYKPEHESQ